MKRKKRQIQKNAAAQPGPAVEPESVPASGKKSVSEKAAAARLTFQKRKKPAYDDAAPGGDPDRECGRPEYHVPEIIQRGLWQREARNNP